MIIKNDLNLWQRVSTVSLIVFATSFTSAFAADDLPITDDYLNSLSEEVSDPAYLKEAKKDLAETEKLEQGNKLDNKELAEALTSMFKFETLLRTKHPSSHSVYVKLPTSSRIMVYDKFLSTKKLSDAKRMIIKQYETK